MMTSRKEWHCQGKLPEDEKHPQELSIETRKQLVVDCYVKSILLYDSKCWTISSENGEMVRGYRNMDLPANALLRRIQYLTWPFTPSEGDRMMKFLGQKGRTGRTSVDMLYWRKKERRQTKDKKYLTSFRKWMDKHLSRKFNICAGDNNVMEWQRTRFSSIQILHCLRRSSENYFS